MQPKSGGGDSSVLQASYSTEILQIRGSILPTLLEPPTEQAKTTIQHANPRCGGKLDYEENGEIKLYLNNAYILYGNLDMIIKSILILKYKRLKKQDIKETSCHKTRR